MKVARLGKLPYLLTDRYSVDRAGMKTLFIICCLLSSGLLGARGGTLVVHEWGTFTSLQDEAGNAIGGLNADDEELPAFTHDLAPWFGSFGPNARLRSKGAPRCCPDVTMRLETPVIYFHPKGVWAGTVDVHVDFLHGLLTQFYPTALFPHNASFGGITPQTEGWLTWKSVSLGGTGDVPKTDAQVWTAPRAVGSALVTTPEGEREKFLFYRGVGNLDSPLRVTRSSGGRLQIRSQFGFESADPMTVSELWLAEFRDGGKCAFRALEPLSGQPASVSTQGSFAEEDFTTGNLSLLRTAMQTALVRDGLYPDEAAAVLNTWELSYFKSGGMRLFFLVPRAWTDHFLPLQISGQTDITRVMVGRIELVSPNQRAALSRLSIAPSRQDYLAPGCFRGQLSPYLMDAFHSQKDYLALGRFRAALLLDEEKHRPSETLEALLSENGLPIPSLP